MQTVNGRGQLRVAVGGMAFVCTVLVCSAGWPLGELLQTFEHQYPLRSVSFSEDGQWVASSANGGSAKVWSPDSGAQRYLVTSGDVRNVRLSRDGRWAVTISQSGAYAWDMHRGQATRKLAAYWATAMDMSPLGPQVLLSSTWDAKVQLVDIESGTILFDIPNPGNDRFGTASFSPDGAQILAGGHVLTRPLTSFAVLWDAAAHTQIRRFDLTGVQCTVTGFAPNGQVLLLATDDNLVTLFDATTGQSIRALTGNSVPVYFYRFSPDGTKMAGWGYPPGPEDPAPGVLWDVATGTVLREFVNGAAFSPDGKYIALGNTDDTASLVDAVTMENVYSFPNAGGGLAKAAFSPDSRRVVITGGDNALRVYYVGAGNPSVYCDDIMNDPGCGEGPLLIADMSVLSPKVQQHFTTLGWASWSDVDMENFDRYVLGEPVTVGDGLPDEYQVALVQYAVNTPGVYHHTLVAQQFEENKALFRQDMDALSASYQGDFVGMKSYDELFSAMLGFSHEMQAAVDAFVRVSTDGASGLPHLADYHIFDLQPAGKASNEPYSAAGDADRDGLTNLEEYNEVLAEGGSPALFASAALDPYNLWQGNAAVPAMGWTGCVLLAGAMLFVLTRRVLASTSAAYGNGRR